jgi:hypothetical protein
VAFARLGIRSTEAERTENPNVIPDGVEHITARILWLAVRSSIRSMSRRSS